MNQTLKKFNQAMKKFSKEYSDSDYDTLLWIKGELRNLAECKSPEKEIKIMNEIVFLIEKVDKSKK